MAKRRVPSEQGEAPKPKRPRQRRPAGPAPGGPGQAQTNGTSTAGGVHSPPAPGSNGAAGRTEELSYRPGNSRRGYGRLLRDVRADAPEWFMKPWISRRNLTLVVGIPGCGKSTFGAWLLSQAARPAILPGNEEDIATSLAPRLLVAGVDPDCCLLLDDRAWRMPQDRLTLTELLLQHRTDLLWIDPLDTYCSVQSENDADGVAEALEAWCKVAHECRCAIVAARHPGKSLANICPGSRHWRRIPREVIELRWEEGPPERRWMRLRRDPYRMLTVPHNYALVGGQGAPPTFSIGAPAELAEVQTFEAKDVADQWKIDEAVEFLRGQLALTEADAQAIYAMGGRVGLDPKTIRYAARRLNCYPTYSGEGGEQKATFPRIPATKAAPP